MQTQISIGSHRNFTLSQALLIYKGDSHKEAFVTLHQVGKQAHCPPTLGPAETLTQGFLDSLIHAVGGNAAVEALGRMIEGGLYEREGKSLTNFGRTLPPEQSEMAVQVLRDPYNFDFLTLTHPLEERKLERGLLTHMRDLLLELGRGFAFVGSQVPLSVGNETFYLDLLFYHVRLHCYFVIELKVGKFRPEYAGKLNFYLSAVDGMMRTDTSGTRPPRQDSLSAALHRRRTIPAAHFGSAQPWRRTPSTRPHRLPR